MAAGYTHYSLFQGTKTLADFAPLPAGGLPELLADLHRRAAPELPNHCLGIGVGTLHPNGEQMSFSVDIRREPVFSVILFTPAALRFQLNELSAERNTESAAAAKAAIASL
jgi:hypothetical protein